MKSSALLREVVRQYVQSQRRTANCGDTASTVECHVLTELHRVSGVTQQELADRLMLDKAWISRGVDRLVQAGLVERTPHESDRRRVQIWLLAPGRSRAAALEARLDSHAESLLAHLLPDQDSQLAGMLEQILVNLNPKQPPPDGACPPSQLHFRRARDSDWPLIEALLRDASLPTEGAVDHLDQFTVGADAAELLAVGGFESHGAFALLRSFVVAPRLRGRGQGSRLLQHILRDAIDAGIENIYLLTESAAPFFERHGFRPMDRKDAPSPIRHTQEFKQLCPASARLMARSLSTLDKAPC